jgi:hypothetical protein
MARALFLLAAAALVAAASAQAPAADVMDASICYQSGLKLGYDKEFRKVRLALHGGRIARMQGACMRPRL